MKIAFDPSLLLVVCLLPWSNVNAFQCNHLTKQLTRNNRLSPFEGAYTSGHWGLSSTELRNENAFPQTSSSSTSSLFSIQIRSIFRTEASETSTITDTTTATYNNRKRDYLRSASAQATSTAARKLKNVSQSLRSLDIVDQLLRFVLQYWWLLPAFVALVPLYTTFVLGVGDAAMPHWWPVTRMDHILKSQDAAMVLGCFLGSNISFFLGGGYLLKKFPFVKPEEVGSSTSVVDRSNAVSSLLWGWKNSLHHLRAVPTRQTWLGLLLLFSGLISTIFHTEQALGSFSIANSLCYLDHAVAGVSTFYFFHTCGKPSKKVWALQLAGLAALSIVPPHPLPGYAWLHSLWHFLAVAAAVVWARESFESNSGSPLVQSISDSELQQSMID